MNVEGSVIRILSEGKAGPSAIKAFRVWRNFNAASMSVGPSRPPFCRRGALGLVLRDGEPELALYG